MSEELPLPEKRELLRDQISTFPDTIDLIQEPTAAGYRAQIEGLQRELRDANAQVEKLTADNERIFNSQQLAWQERAEAIAREADLERLLKDAVRLLGYFVGMR